MFRRGKRVRAETKTVAFNVYKYFKAQLRKGGISTSALHRTVKATGLSRSTIVRIVGDKRRLQENEDFPTPTKRYYSSRKRILPDDFDREAIRRRIYYLYQQKVNITLKRLLVSTIAFGNASYCC